MSPTPEAENRRRFSRVTTHHTVKLSRADGQTLMGQYHDISLNGMLFQGENLPAIGTQWVGELTLASDVVIVFHGEVVKHEPNDGAAIHFVEVDAESFTHLRRLVSLNLGDAEQIDQELSNHL
uniref:Type IV pilus assembly PilZ n=1 Tax=Magnetococcus massalia (strain MO-1) TaxID=451514 RepID=A0A1S7LPQ3_MAGMO|nr:Type IV pilus assembly PilZ [Candidatus Magnetococcus massalia]